MAAAIEWGAFSLQRESEVTSFYNKVFI